MCGRYALGLQRAQIRGLPGHPYLAIGEWIGEHDFMPRYNIAPNTNAPVIRQYGTSLGSAAITNPNPNPTPASTLLVMQTMRWGISYGKETAKGTQAINARSENIIDGVGMWNRFRGKNRCVVVCQGYYEWQTKGRDKLPYFTKHPDGKVMLLAGLYAETIEKGRSDPTHTFVIVTTDASKSLSWLHDRQPVILSTSDEIYQWLDTSSQAWSADLARCLHPWSDSAAKLECYQVAKEIGKVGRESAKFIEPIVERKDGIMAMFAKQKLKQTERSAKRKRSPTPTPSPQPLTNVFETEEHEEKRLKTV